MQKKITKINGLSILFIDGIQFPGSYDSKQTANYAFKFFKHKEKIKNLQEKIIQKEYNTLATTTRINPSAASAITYKMLDNLGKEIIQAKQNEIDKLVQGKPKKEEEIERIPQIEHVIKLFYDCNCCHQKVIFSKREKETNILKSKIQGLSIDNIGGSINLSCGNCGNIIKIKRKNKKQNKDMENTENNQTPVIIERNEDGSPVDCPTPCGEWNVNPSACDNCSQRNIKEIE